MHKKLLSLFLIFTMSVSMYACGQETAKNNNESDVVDQEEVDKTDMSILDFDYKDYVDLGEYKGLELKYLIPTVSDDEVKEEALNITYDNVKYTIKDTGAEAGDLLTIDFVGTIDGQGFDGGSDMDYMFYLGEGEFLDEFEENIYGAKAGDTVSAQFVFPENYGEVSGKEVEFTIDIKLVQQMTYPEYNDALVAEKTDYKTTGEYEASLYESLLSEAKKSSMELAGEEALSMVMKNSTVFTLPEKLLKYAYYSTYNSYSSTAEMLGMQMEEFMASYGNDSDDPVFTDAVSWTKEIVFYKAIGDLEKIDFDSIYDEELKSLSAEYGFDNAEDFENTYGKLDIYLSVMRSAVINKLMESASINEMTEEEYYADEDEVDYSYYDEESYLDEEELLSEEELELDED